MNERSSPRHFEGRQERNFIILLIENILFCTYSRMVLLQKYV